MDIFIAATSTSSLETPGKCIHQHVSRKPIQTFETQQSQMKHFVSCA